MNFILLFTRYGEDLSGDVYNPENIEYVGTYVIFSLFFLYTILFLFLSTIFIVLIIFYLASKVRKAAMVVADGGFKIEKDAETGLHLENLQELV